MSGHNKWSKIKNTKGKEDSKRAKIFTKLARAIIVAVREAGPEPDYNSSLKLAIEKAKSVNMPNENIQRAIAKGVGKDTGDDYQQMVYEGYGPEGVAIIVECLSDNKNRTASNIRYYFDKFGGNLGQTGSVGFIFDLNGIISVEKNGIDEEEFILSAIEGGASDVEITEDEFVVITEKERFIEVKKYLENNDYEIQKAQIMYIPKTTATITDEENKKNMTQLLDNLEDDDDVQEVYTNWEEE